MFENIKNPVIFGHRGACALAPENTIASFELAAEHQADFVELDAKLSVDGKVMVIHDQTVDRTTTGKGKVNELTLTALKALDAGVKFNPNYSGEKIPTLDEVFEAVGNKVMVNVELTNYASPKDELIEMVAQIVIRHNLKHRVLFSSFLPKNLVMMKKILPVTPLALLCLPGVGGIFSRSFLLNHVSPSIIHPYLTDVNPTYVRMQQARNRRVHVWTVNTDKDIQHMLDLKVDGIFTDDPRKVRDLMSKPSKPKL